MHNNQSKKFTRFGKNNSIIRQIGERQRLAQNYTSGITPSPFVSPTAVRPDKTGSPVTFLERVMAVRLWAPAVSPAPYEGAKKAVAKATEVFNFSHYFLKKGSGIPPTLSYQWVSQKFVRLVFVLGRC